MSFNKIITIQAQTEAEAAQVAQAFIDFQKIFKPTEILKIAKLIKNPIKAQFVRSQI